MLTEVKKSKNNNKSKKTKENEIGKRKQTEERRGVSRKVAQLSSELTLFPTFFADFSVSKLVSAAVAQKQETATAAAHNY